MILVHGIAQEQTSSDRLEDEWIQDLAGGVRSAGYGELADQIRLGRFHAGIKARMAYYADLFLVPGQMGAKLNDLSQTELEIATPLAREWLERAAIRSGHSVQQQTAVQQLALVDGQTGEEQGLAQYGRPALNALAKIAWFAPFGFWFAQTFVVRALKQVSQYFSDAETREAAISRVLNLIDKDTKVIIAHSLGSIVAYEAVCRAQIPIPFLITMGSPLGLETIIYQRLLPQPPIYPREVRRWVNIYDPDDLIAAEPDLRARFSTDKPTGAGMESFIVDCDAMPHEASRYLCKSEVGRIVAQALA